jgi:molecular chaperone DnaK
LRELIDARNGAEAAVHEVKRELKERDAVLTESVKSSVNAAIVVVEDAIRGEDADAMRTAVEKLWESARPVMEANAQQQAQPADDGVVDAEFTETK